MPLTFTHKPNYFLHAHSLVNFLVQQISKADTNSSTQTYVLRDIYHVFGDDFASATSNLEGILNLADNYHIGVEDDAHILIQKYSINGEANTLTIQFNPAAIESIKQGAQVIAPDATVYS